MQCPKRPDRGWKSLGSGVKGGCKLKEAWVLATEEGQDLEKVNNKRKTLGDGTWSLPPLPPRFLGTMR